ncbi:MAG: SAM-dependent methyltransferase [Candidatus Micrarchaeaceae archaeon]
MPTISIEESNKRFYSSKVSIKLPFITEAMEEPYRRAAANLILDRYGDLLLSGSSLNILEAGCNTGYFMKGLYNSIVQADGGKYSYAVNHITYTGVDISRYALIEAGKIAESAEGNFFKTKLIRKDLSKDGVPGSYDIVIANELLDDIGSLIYTNSNGAIYELRPLEKISNGFFTITPQRFSVNYGESKRRFEALDGWEKDEVRSLADGEVTVVSPNSIRLVENLMSAMRKGGTMLLHDYGWVGSKRAARFGMVVRAYGTNCPPGESTELEELAGKFQITADVNFNEIARILRKHGNTRVMEHQEFLEEYRGKRGPRLRVDFDNYGFFDVIFTKQTE